METSFVKIHVPQKNRFLTTWVE